MRDGSDPTAVLGLDGREMACQSQGVARLIWSRVIYENIAGIQESHEEGH